MKQGSLLLIFPPVAKISEPPAGIARLAGSLTANGIPHRLWDANLEGQLWLMGQPPSSADTWTGRAWRSREASLKALKDAKVYKNRGRYNSAVNDINRLLNIAGKNRQSDISISDFRHETLSPVKSEDLLYAAAHPEINPFYGFFCEKLPELIDSTDTTGISITYLSQALCGFALAGLIRLKYPKMKIVMGGGLITSWMQRPGWQNPFGELVDLMVSGSGETALLGLYGCKTDITPVTAPCYEQLPLDQYLSPGLVIPYSAAGGCWWNRCSFCPERAEGNHYAPLPISQATAEIHYLAEKYRPSLLHLLDNAISPSLLQRLADDPPGVPWYGFTRFEKQLTDMDFCIKLRKSGCVMLKTGIESGDQFVLDRMHKGIRLETAAVILENLHQAGICVYGYLLFGTPSENLESARRTLDFTKQMHHAITFLNLAIFNMPVYGDETAEYDTELFYEGDLSLYTGFTHPDGWNRGTIRRFLRQEFTRNAETAAIIRRDPAFFTSNHAPFFCIAGNL